MDERAVGGERPVAECLGKIVGGIVVVDPENALVFPAEKVLRVGQLHAESRRTLKQPRHLRRGVRAISDREPVGGRYAAIERWPGVGAGEVIVVVAAVAAGGDQTAVVGVRREQQVLGQKLRAGEVHEVQQVVGEVGRVALLPPVVEHAQRRRAVAEQARIGVGVAQVQVGPVGLPTHLPEGLPEDGRGHVAPAALVEVLNGAKVIERPARTSALPLERATAEGAATGFEFSSGIVVSALGLQRQRSAQSVESENRVGAGNE